MTDQRMDSEAKARRMNEELGKIVYRRIIRHAILAVFLLLVAGIAIYLATTTPTRADHYFLLALAGALGALICGVFYLDAYGHWREIKGRRWARLTPRFGQHSPQSPAAKTEDSPRSSMP